MGYKHGGHEGDEGGQACHEHVCHVEDHGREDGAQAEDSQGRVQCALRDCPDRSKPHAEFQNPAHRDAEAQAQACEEGREEDDVREGGEGRGEAREEGRESLRREGAQGFRVRTFSLGLGTLQEDSSTYEQLSTATWSCHGWRVASGCSVVEGVCAALYMEGRW